MINFNNKQQLKSISTEIPFPTGRVDVRFEAIRDNLSRASSGMLTPEGVLELAGRIKLFAKQIEEITEEWKGKV